MRRGNGLIWLALALITLGVYAPVLQNDFINLDDGGYVTENPEVKQGLSAGGIAWAFTSAGYMSNWHPVTWISHMVDCQIYGLRPWGHHLTNVLLHTANALLLLAVLLRMTGALWRSAFVAAVFAWHPLHVESVAWVSERKDVLSTFFWLLTMLAYVRYAQGSKVQGSKFKVFYGLAVVCFALGLMAKAMLVTLPFVLLLMDYWPLGRVGGCGEQNAELKRGAGEPVPQINWVSALWEKAPFFVLSIISSAVTILAQREGGSVATVGQVSMGMRLATAAVAYCRYIEKFLWPRHLSVFYPPVPGWPKSTVLGAAIFLGAISVAAFRARRKSPYLPVGWLWFLGTLVPVVGFLQVGTQSLADRYTYVPMIGLLIMVVWDVEAQSKDWLIRGATLGLAGAVLLGACLSLTWKREQDWRNSETLFRQALAVAPVNNFMAHACLGHCLVDEGKNAEAIEHFQAALKVAPSYNPAHYGIGRALVAEGRWQEAADNLMVAAKNYPNNPEVHRWLGQALAKLGRKDEAIEQYLVAVRLDPQFAESRLNLGDLLAEAGRFQEAEAAALKAREAASSAGRQDLVEAAQKRLDSYRAGKLYRE